MSGMLSEHSAAPVLESYAGLTSLPLTVFKSLREGCERRWLPLVRLAWCRAAPSLHSHAQSGKEKNVSVSLRWLLELTSTSGTKWTICVK